jgi:hypothetical protein
VAEADTLPVTNIDRLVRKLDEAADLLARHTVHVAS